MKKIIFSLLILIISYNGYSQNNVFSKNVFNNDTLVSRFMSLKKQTSYPSNPRTNTIINYKDTLKYYDGVQWKSVNNTGIPYTGAYKSIDFNGKVIKNFFISKTADTTAKVVFDVSSIPTNTIRTINVPNRSFRLDSLTTTTSTAINGLLKGNGANLAAATGNTDYQLPYFLKTGSSITPITSTNYLTFNKDNTGTTVGQAIELFNNQAATIGSQSQYSPVIRWKASRWDTDDAIARTSFMEMGDIYSAGTTAPFAGLLVRGSTDGVTYADFFRITHRLSDNTADYNLTGALTTSSSATATNYAVSSTSTNSYTASKLNIGTVRRLAFYSPNDQAATVGTPVQNPGRITLSGAVYNSVTQGHVWDIHLSGVANTKYSSILFSHSTDGTTSVRNFLNLKAGLSVTGNSFLMSDGLSDLSPNLAITSAGKSISIGGNASNSYLVADNSAAFIIGGDSKANIDEGTPTPTAWLTVSNTQFSISKLSNRRVPFNTTSEGLKDTIGFEFAGGYLDVPGLKIAGSIFTPISLRTFGDVGTGAVYYNGTTKSNGKFYGGTSDPDGSTRGNYDGYWYASKLYSSNQIYAGTNLSDNITIGTSNIIMTSGGNTTINISPTTDAATSPYIFKTTVNHTSNNIFELYNLNSLKFNVDYTGKVIAEGGARIGTSGSNTTISANGYIILPAGSTTAGTAPLKFTTQASGLATVEQGAMELIGNSLQFTNLAVRRAIVQNSFLVTSDVAVTNTTTETEIASIPHGANYLEVGKKENILLQGTINSVSGAGANTLTIRVKYAGTTYATFVIIEAARTTQNIEIHVMTTCRAIGNGTTSIQIHARSEIDNEANDATINTLATGLNSTVMQATSVTAEWSDASASNSLVILQGECLSVDKPK